VGLHDLLYMAPLIERLFADLELAVIAQVFDLSFVRTAPRANIVEVDIDDEVWRDNFALVFPDVLGTQFHLAGLDVVASLDEGRVEHDAEHDFVGETRVFENYLHVALQDQVTLLLLRQKEDHAVLFLAVLLLGGIRELFADVQSTAAVNFEKGHAAPTRHIGNLNELDAS